MSNQKPFERLPKTVTPVNYNIQLTPDLKKLNFHGIETIDIKINEPTDRIVLNSSKIQIENDSSYLKLANGEKKIAFKDILLNESEETATFVLPEKVEPGSAVLNVTFNAELNDKLRGFYPSKYIGPDEVERVTAVTQFESTDARRAFPCWDEPAIKATFDITLVVPDDGKTKALSNMPIKEESKNEQKLRVVKFERTPIMSTYLVAFVVGEYDFIEARSKHGVLIRVYTPVGKSAQGKFSLDVATKSLDYFTDYFQIPYPLVKMDLIAISDFEAGAMENWGLVTFRETALLVDEAHTSTIVKQNISVTVAHELAHQWFGNLVTMEWWTHLWLNEGFATFMQYLCVDYIFPDFDIWTQFVSDVLFEAMDLDSLDNSHAIEIPVGHPSEIDQIFDDISYSKGASVIRMLYHYIGDELFRKGMKAYLLKHSYKNALTEDLWDALEEASKKPIRRMMSTWTKQKGYPVITAKTQKNDGKLSLHLKQEKFNSTGVLSAEDEKMLWANPIQIISEKSPEKVQKQFLFEKREDTFELDGFNSNEWLKMNPSAVGVYRVNYDHSIMERLCVAHECIKPVDRLNMIDDLFAMTLAGHKSSDNLFRAIDSFKNECHYSVWTVLNNILSKYNQLLFETDYYTKFVKFGTKLITHSVYHKIGWDPKPQEPHLDTLLRSMLIGKLVIFEYPEVIDKCKQLFNDYVENGKQIPADLRSCVYRAMARNCDERIWEIFMKLYREADLQQEKQRLVMALGGVTKPEFIDRVLNFAISDSVRTQDTVFVVISVSNNPLARQTAWKFFLKNKELFKKRYEIGFLGNRLIKCICENFQTQQMANEIEIFFKTNEFPGWERSIKQAIETIKLNSQLFKRDQTKLANYFNEVE